MKRRLRPRTATWMVAIAPIALGLGGHRAHRDAIRRDQVDRAAALPRDPARMSGGPADAPTCDPARLDAQLGAMTFRGTAREVGFTDRVSGATVTATIPASRPRPGARIVADGPRPVVPPSASWFSMR